MARARILIVEDEVIVARELEARLAGLGYDPLPIATSGEEALELISTTTKPDLVLMDIVLKQDMDGIAAADEIRRRFDVPVVFLTAYSDEYTLQRAQLTGPFGYIVKPFNEKELRPTIEVALYKHRTESVLRKSERCLAATLEGLADAVLTTDRDGRITGMNPAAEALTGWKGDEAIGQDTNQVFRIINRQTRARAENPVMQALSQERTVPLPENTLLITKAGGEIPIADHAGPIRNEEGSVLGAVLSFRDTTQQQQIEEALREDASRLRALAHHLMSLQEDERSRGAHHLNEEIYQVLASLKFHAFTMMQLNSPDFEAFSETHQKLIDRAMQQTRELASELRPPLLDDFGLEKALRSYLVHWAKKSGLEWRLESNLSAERLPAALELASFRVIQEALKNLARHARARQVEIHLECRGSELHLLIRDDGVGFDREAARQHAVTRELLGLVEMQERAARWGGSITIESSPGAGTTVRGRIPLAEKGDGNGPASETREDPSRPVP